MLDTYKCLKATQFGVNHLVLHVRNLRTKDIKEHALGFGIQSHSVFFKIQALSSPPITIHHFF